MARIGALAWQLYLQSRAYISFDRALLRSLVLAGFCLWLVIANWHFVLAPLHRTMALGVIGVAVSFIVFYELTVRDVPSGAVLTAVAAILGGAGLLWLGLASFYRPLPNDHAPLLAGQETSGRCAAPSGTLHVLLGKDEVLAKADGPVTPFRIANCPGPTLRRMPAGVMVTGFGYDDDGTVIWQLRDNQFTRLEGDYLHAHRPDRSSLGLYDKWEREIFFIRYLTPDVVRIRGRFLCGAAPVVSIGSAIEIGSRRFSRPRCLWSSAAGVNYAPAQ